MHRFFSTHTFRNGEIENLLQIPPKMIHIRNRSLSPFFGLAMWLHLTVQKETRYGIA